MAIQSEKDKVYIKTLKKCYFIYSSECQHLSALKKKRTKKKYISMGNFIEYTKKIETLDKHYYKLVSHKSKTLKILHQKKVDVLESDVNDSEKRKQLELLIELEGDLLTASFS